MASTAHKNPEEIEEQFETPEVVMEKSLILAKWIAEAKHFIAFTGAGISTSSGIPDFRGPQGVWTLRAQGKTRKAPTVSTICAIPTASHMSLKTLIETGHLKHLISQNTDGMHMRSGISRANLSELHGNSTLEICTVCKAEYLRDFRVRTASEVHEHKTGRFCNKCKGALMDTIINFGENLPEKPLEKSFSESEIADLCLSLGSSLRVTPAADIPKTVAKRGQKLVIVNLQTTPLDDKAALVIRAKIDDVMRIVMNTLKIEIPPFILHRFIKVIISVHVDKKAMFLIEGVNPDGLPASILRSVEVTLPGKKTCLLEKEPFIIEEKNYEMGDVEVGFAFNFMGNFREPPFQITLPSPSISSGGITVSHTLSLDFAPSVGNWEVKNIQTLDVERKK